MSEFTEEPRPREVPSLKIIEQKQGRFFVRESYLNEDTNQVHWVISPTDENAGEQEFSVIVPRDHPQMGASIANLDGAIMDMTKIHIIKTESAPDFWQVHSCAPTMPDASRGIQKNGEALSTWTPDLSDKVEKYCELRMFEAASEVKSDMYSSMNIMSEVKVATGKLFANRAAIMFPDLAVEEIDEYVKATSDPESMHRNKTFNELMSGRQMDSEGNEERVFYHTEYPVSEQLDMNGSQESVMSGLYNYCAQASAANLIKANLAEGPGLLEPCEKELNKMKALVATHPTRTKEDYAILDAEYAELISGESIRSQMAACGARPANPQYDDVNIGYENNRLGRGQDDTFGNEICQRIMKDSADSKKLPADPFLDYLEREKTHSHELARGTKRKVEVAQDAAMAHGKERNPRGIPEPVKGVGRGIANGAKAGVSHAVKMLDDLDIE